MKQIFIILKNITQLAELMDGLAQYELRMMTCLLAVLNSCKRLMLRNIHSSPILSSCCNTLIEEAQHYIITLPFNERGEPTASYRWAGWIWEITGRSSRLHENYPSILEEFMEYTSNRWRKAERSQHVTGWTWKHYEFHRLCPKTFPDTDLLPTSCLYHAPLLHFRQ